VLNQVTFQKPGLQIVPAVIVEIDAEEGNLVQDVQIAKVIVELNAIKNHGIVQQKNVSGMHLPFTVIFPFFKRRKVQERQRKRFFYFVSK